MLLCGTTALQAEPSHGIAMYGEPALPEGFTALPYANPDAPTGGRMATAEVGGFDSLNPYILKGSVPWQLSYLIGESLMRQHDVAAATHALRAGDSPGSGASVSLSESDRS